jgi:2-polyprenyl-3-methyl-5-hydroxy-6-metoxy-1,4-benzoquinol methylase
MDYQDKELFDSVLMGEIIEHVAFPQNLLKVAHRNLKTGGVLILTTPNGNEYAQGLQTYSQVTDIEALIPKQFHWGDHLFLFTEEELRKLLDEAGFEVLEVVRLNSSYFTQIKGVRYILPLAALKWIEKKTRNWKKMAKTAQIAWLLWREKNESTSHERSLD